MCKTNIYCKDDNSALSVGGKTHKLKSYHAEKDMNYSLVVFQLRPNGLLCGEPQIMATT